ncbi:branched-chain amino acid ABC transporter permease [Bradyrhizobium sp. NP1]|uniref:branched-chain amino acid ABC transporter permease n=1 Tax=Bradyrhizobium sp. NP1 TaxID=3049772 RepID=UPI0025A61E61|nr:branched-chain amino acid ABC transporter permease [Bradyrhizobium sp. NP1]WJR76627.1 branched-chain amino acid ABC transporter permease [Bradyrhizobium sp. NP1]
MTPAIVHPAVPGLQPWAKSLLLLVACPLAAASIRLLSATELGFVIAALAIFLFVPATRRIATGLLGRGAAGPSPWLASLLGAALVPFVLGSDGYWFFVLSLTMIFAMMALGLNIQLGEIGVVNLGFAGLFALAAYASTLLTIQGVPFWLAMLGATALCWVTGALLGLCSLRTTGDYFALVTLGFGLIVYQLVVNLRGLTRGSDGITNIPAITVFGHSAKSPLNIGGLVLPPQANGYYLCLAVLAVLVFVALRFRHSWIGRTWGAVRQDAVGVSCFGVNVPVFRVLTIAFGSAFAGPAGSLFAHLIGFISPDDFTLLQSIEVLAIVILGGMGNIGGILVGSAILMIMPEKLRALGDYRLMIYGAMLVVLLIYRPKGLFPDPRRIFDKA